MLNPPFLNKPTILMIDLGSSTGLQIFLPVCHSSPTSPTTLRPSTMPRKFIDKKKAATFHLVHRSHRDPLINDPDSSARVLKYVPPTNLKSTAPGSSKNLVAAAGSKGPITRSALDETVDVDAVRENEGEAAEYGIYFDDTDYDYMQHLRS